MAQTDTLKKKKVLTQNNNIDTLCDAHGYNLRHLTVKCLMMTAICSMPGIITLAHSQNKGQQVCTNDFSHN